MEWGICCGNVCVFGPIPPLCHAAGIIAAAVLVPLAFIVFVIAAGVGGYIYYKRHKHPKWEAMGKWLGRGGAGRCDLLSHILCAFLWFFLLFLFLSHPPFPCLSLLPTQRIQATCHSRWSQRCDWWHVWCHMTIAVFLCLDCTVVQAFDCPSCVKEVHVMTTNSLLFLLCCFSMCFAAFLCALLLFYV